MRLRPVIPLLPFHFARPDTSPLILLKFQQIMTSHDKATVKFEKANLKNMDICRHGYVARPVLYPTKRLLSFTLVFLFFFLFLFLLYIFAASLFFFSIFTLFLALSFSLSLSLSLSFFILIIFSHIYFFKRKRIQ
jgi:hypothetical protein